MQLGYAGEGKCGRISADAFMSTTTTTTHPTLGKPTTPIFKLLLGRPRRIFGSTAPFFGGIFFLLLLLLFLRWDEKLRRLLLWR